MAKKPALAGKWPTLLACAATALAVVTSCSSSSAPSWAAGLGSGVTVQSPAQVPPGNDSPGAAVAGVIAATTAKRYVDICDYAEPSVQAECKQDMTGIPASAEQTVKNGKIGYIAIHGDEALVGTTGTFCAPTETPKCFTNNNPAAILSSGKPFATLWTEANNTASDNVYTLAPCIKVDGKWYLNS
jgi:hypothetical protein